MIGYICHKSRLPGKLVQSLRLEIGQAAARIDNLSTKIPVIPFSKRPAVTFRHQPAAVRNSNRIHLTILNGIKLSPDKRASGNNSISNILFKLGLRDRTQLAIWAVQTGAVNQPL